MSKINEYIRNLPYYIERWEEKVKLKRMRYDIDKKMASIDKGENAPTSSKNGSNPILGAFFKRQAYKKYNKTKVQYAKEGRKYFELEEGQIVPFYVEWYASLVVLGLAYLMLMVFNSWLSIVFVILWWYLPKIGYSMLMSKSVKRTLYQLDKIKGNGREKLGAMGDEEKYCYLPLRLEELDKMLLDFLNDSKSGERNAVIVGSKVYESNQYGIMRALKIDNVFKDNEAKTTEDFAFRQMYLLPHREHESMKARYFEGGLVYQALGFASLRKMKEFYEVVSDDPKLVGVFKDIEAGRQEERDQALLEEKRAEEERLRMVYTEMALEKGINKKLGFVLTKIDNFKDVWSFGLWQVSNESIVGNGSYAKIRCIFRNGASIRDVRKLQDKIQAELRDTVIIKELNDKGSFELIVLFEPELSPYKEYLDDIVYEYNQNDRVYIGKSYTGDMTVEWNNQALHVLVGGKSGSGKSVQIVGLLSQLVNLASFDYKTLLITSSSKTGDFAPFKKKGATVVSGLEEQKRIFENVLNLCMDRERKFEKGGVSNLVEWNKEYPNEYMNRIILVADEWENSVNSVDKKLGNQLESLLVEILNIARSSGVLVIVGSQSILKGDVGRVADKMTTKFSGSNSKNILMQISTEVASYYGTLDRKPQGVFFYNAENLEADVDVIPFGDSGYTLIQTPYIVNIDESLPKLQGEEVFGGMIEQSKEAVLNIDVLKLD